MKCKKFSIETNGTIEGTKVLVDEKPLGLIQRIEFSASTDKPYPTIMLVQALVNGKTKISKVRDPKSEKFIEKKEVESQALLIEFER
jgi:hypothetical protein